MACKKPQEKSPCVAEGRPVNPILGIKMLTEEPDVFVDAHLPLVWRRTYASDVAHEGMLGQGWSLDFGHRLEMHEEEIHLYDGYGKKDVFPRLAVGESQHIPKGRLELSCVAEGVYVYHVGNRYYHFVSAEGGFRLTHIKDNNDNAIQFFYEDGRAFASFIALDNHRLFRLHGNAHRLLGLEELLFDKTSLRKNLLQTSTELLLVHYHQEDERTRVSAIERYALDEQEKLMQEHSIYEVLATDKETQVRYAYSDEEDLIGVYGKGDLLRRTFTYTNHIMTSHCVPEGLESYYAYDVYDVEGKVLKNTTNTGQSWHFDYQEGQTVVTDALGRETVYKYDQDNYFTSKINPLHQESVLRYTPQGQIKEVVGATQKAQSFSYDANGQMLESRTGMVGATRYKYHLKYHKPTVIEDEKGKTLLSYDAKANLIKQRLPNKETVEYQRDLYGNVSEILDAQGGRSTLAYNLSGNLTKHTDPLGRVTTLTYDDNENLVKLTDIHGDVTHYSYNTQDKLTQITYADGSTQSYTYTPLGKLLSHTDTFSTTTHYTTDKADNLVEISSPNNRQIHYSYDVEGRLLVEVDPEGKEKTYSYDVLDRVTAIEDATKQ